MGHPFLRFCPRILGALPPRRIIRVAAVLLVLCGFALWLRPAEPSGSAPMTTSERLASTAWWPTHPAAGREGYAGTEACADCHGDIVQSQARSQMAHTLMPAAVSDVLATHEHATYTSGPYTSSFTHQAKQWELHVSDGHESRSARLEWAFGSGEVGQSYLWQAADGTYRESRFNYFASVNGLAATPGRLHGAPVSLDMAVGRQVQPFEARTCFACHTTYLTSTPRLDPHNLEPGVRCEACHGPGAKHVAALRSGANPETVASATILNPAHLTPVQAVDYCGACHSTAWDVRMMGAVGLQTVRFPAYRLEKSRCWGTSGDRRVTCFACHDPHAPLETKPAAYDAACLRCHRATRQQVADAQHPGAACPVATTKCVTCHMQKYELPEMHANFTDHWIRIARPGAPLPD